MSILPECQQVPGRENETKTAEIHSALQFEYDGKREGCTEMLFATTPPAAQQPTEEDHAVLLDRHQRQRPQIVSLSHWVTQQYFTSSICTQTSTYP